MAAVSSYDDVPRCCKNCHNYDWEWSEWHATTYRYCMKNVWWPTKSQACKKQDPIEQKEERHE